MNNYFTDVSGTKFTSSLNLSEAFGRPHADILKTIRKSSISNKEIHFVESEFVNDRNRSYPIYLIDSVGFSYLMISNTFRRKPSMCALFTSKLGGDTPLIIEAEVRHEDRFSCLLSSAINATCIENKNIERQFNVGSYRVDFYMPSENMVIEYDEEQHSSSNSKSCDEIRMAYISDALTRTCNVSAVKTKPKIVRVKKGEEGKGIVDIIAILASGTSADCILDID